MVLDRLGDSLKNALRKITGAGIIDEKTVNELVKDIQRALLQADVNVKLVLELTKRIKRRVLEERPPVGVNRREHIIKTVYDELVKFLGGKGAKISAEKKPFKIMLVGLFGNGKCIHKNSNVLLCSGQTIGAEKLYDLYRSNGENVLEDGYIIPLKDELYVPSLNTKTLKIEKKRVSYLWKLKSKDIVKVNLDNGNNFSVKVTHEHPFFILNNGKIEQRRADELNKGDIVAVPRKHITQPLHQEFKDKLLQQDIDIFLNLEEVKEVKERIVSQYGNLKKGLAKLPYKRNYAKFTQSFKKGQIPIFFYNLNGKDRIKIKSHDAQEAVEFPTILTPQLAEFIGYIIGDGYLSKRSVNIHNKDAEIIERIKELSQTLFSKSCSITKDKRTRKLLHLRLNSVTLVEIINKLFGIPIGKKGRRLEVPKLIQTAHIEIVSSFIRAYFDCDAHFNPKQREIEITSESQILIKQIHHLLLRFDILGVQIKKKVKNKEYYLLIIQAKNAFKYSKKINSRVRRKQKALGKYEIITVKQGDGKQDMIFVGALMKKLRESKGYSISQIQKNISSYGLYEKNERISRTSLQKVVSFYEKKEKGNFAKLVDLITNKKADKFSESLKVNQSLINALVGELKKQGMIVEVTNFHRKISLTEKGKQYLDNIKRNDSDKLLKTLKLLANSDLCWIPVKKVSKIKNDSNFVYDLTVEDNHNFIADGIIVHNTTTAGKLGKYFMKRGRRVALIQTDTWRPAAFHQLKQLSESIGASFFGDEKEKDAVKIYKKYEKGLNDFDIVIVDTAGRDALSSELIDELNKINKAVNADERLLVMSADVGQAAQSQAKTFHDTCNVTGVIITKLDGTAKGGGALSACAVTGAPVKFIGVGEKIDDLEEFRPEGFVGRLLGMGDLEALLEKAKEAIDADKAEDLGKRFLKGEFNLLDLYEQMSAMKKMGSLKKIMKLMPGFGGVDIPKEMLDVQEGKLEKWKHIMSSMTKEELEDPEAVMNPSRIERISKGSGQDIADVRSLLKQYKQSKKMVKMFKGGLNEKQMQKVMQKIGKRGKSVKFR